MMHRPVILPHPIPTRIAACIYREIGRLDALNTVDVLRAVDAGIRAAQEEHEKWLAARDEGARA